MEIYFISDLHITSHIPPHEGYSNIAKYKKFLDKYTLPADVLCVAGDIANNTISEVNLLVAASKMFDKVIYVNGNSEISCKNEEAGVTTAQKLDKIEKFVQNKVGSKSKVIRLDGTPVIYDTVKFTGTMSMADDKFAKKIHKDDHSWNAQTQFLEDSFNYWKWWSNDFYELSKYEIDKLIKANSNENAGSDVIMTHFAPLNFVNPNDYPFIHKKEFLTFDAKKVIDTIKDGAIWQYGHLHIKDKRTIKTKNGEFLLINNSIGRKDSMADTKKFTKRDFLINL